MPPLIANTNTNHHRVSKTSPFSKNMPSCFSDRFTTSMDRGGALHFHAILTLKDIRKGCSKAFACTLLQ